MQNSVYHDTASHFLFNDISNPSGREDKNWLKCEGDFFPYRASAASKALFGTPNCISNVYARKKSSSATRQSRSTCLLCILNDNINSINRDYFPVKNSLKLQNRINEQKGK